VSACCSFCRAFGDAGADGGLVDTAQLAFELRIDHTGTTTSTVDTLILWRLIEQRCIAAGTLPTIGFLAAPIVAGGIGADVGLPKTVLPHTT
jgi:hypothetical protein